MGWSALLGLGGPTLQQRLYCAALSSLGLKPRGVSWRSSLDRLIQGPNFRGRNITDGLMAGRPVASGGLRAVFNRVQIDHIKPHHVRLYMDKRGQTAKARANREKALLSHLYNRAREGGSRTLTHLQEAKRLNPLALMNAR